MATTLRIDRTTTSWVFVSDSDEPRHLWDIVLGAHVLNVKSVPRDQVYVCTNHSEAAQHLNPYGIRDIHPIDQLDAVLAGLSCEILVLIVGGHGRRDGIGQDKRILSPAETISKVRSVTSIKAGVIILSQCFSGIFNLLDAEADPPLVLIGATNLNDSLSAQVSLADPLPLENGSPGPCKAWQASIFGLSLFRWLASPSDIDGDGELTILDAFKFAGTASDERLITEKGDLFANAVFLANQLRELAEQRPAPHSTDQPDSHMFERKAIEDKLRERLQALYLHQEPWILNPHLARRLTVAL
jgi:hypothetical protein